MFRDPEETSPADEPEALEPARSSLAAWVLSGPGGTPRLSLVVAGVLALSAGLIGLRLLLRPPLSLSLREVGAFTAAMDVKRGQKRWRLSGKHWLQPGDEIRFTYNAPRPGYLYVVGLAARRVTVYVPQGEPRLVARGRQQQLPHAVLLKEPVTGTKRIIALLCPAKVSRQSLLSAARAAISRARNTAAVARLNLPCAQSSHLVQRRQTEVGPNL